MPSHAICRDAVTSLHGFFVDWYTGRASDRTVRRVKRALAPEFEMVTPEGETRDREAALEGIRSKGNRYEPGAFDIEIRAVETRRALGDHRLLRYEEWQEIPTETTGRVSTVLFESNAAAPDGVVWLDLHETWLARPTAGDDG